MKDPLVFDKRFKGFYIKFQNFNRTRTFHDWSFAFGGCKESSSRFKNGYDKPKTHDGRDIYFFATFFNYQISFGHEKLNSVKGE